MVRTTSERAEIACSMVDFALTLDHKVASRLRVDRRSTPNRIDKLRYVIHSGRIEGYRCDEEW